MADKPSRALVLFGYGVAPHITPSHSHFHALATRGCCGFLAFEDSSPTPGVDDEKLIRELAQLLDAKDSFFTAVQNEKDSGSEASKQLSSIKERLKTGFGFVIRFHKNIFTVLSQFKFMGMRAALVTSSYAAKCFGEKLGFSVLDLQFAESAADELLELLGFQNEKIIETNQFDLVFVHIGADEGNNAGNILKNANNVVGRILQVAQPGSEIALRLHFTLIMSYGSVTVDDPNLSLASLHDGNNSDLLSLFPRQSYSLKGVNPRNGIRHHCPALIAQWQDAVTRKDMAQEFSFSEFQKNCGNLAIAADRFIYETAFKLWKAPKYGA